MTAGVLEGRYARLEPLSLDHLDGLSAAGLEPELWRWTPHIVRSRDEMRSYIQDALGEREKGTMVPFAVIEKKSGKAAGSTRFANISKTDRHAEIGWTWLGKPWQRTGLNTEAKLLLLTYAFETWGCIRVEFKTDALNEPVRAALLRIGAKEEGVFRKHRLTYSGRVRDTVWYSILDSEWPAVKADLEAKLRRS
jgi:RimJ/RimL family protein N-acetyltransferase